MTLPLREPPASICVMRMSAIGDVCHALPVVRTLQTHWPHTAITWIIGKTEAGLVGDIPEIEFIVFDKSGGLGAIADLRREMQGRRFDVLLHMQVSARSNLAALFVPATVKLGYDRKRAKELQFLVTNAQVAPRENQHAIDAMFGFAEALGIEGRELRWDIPIPRAARAFCDLRLDEAKPLLVINPCSSPSKRVFRSWPPARYAAVADHAADEHGMQVVLCGGPTDDERAAGAEVERATRQPVMNLIGKTSLKELAALLQRAKALVTSDSGPAHIGVAVGTPVIGLYAATNPHQTGPYRNLDWVVDKYPEAVSLEYHCTPEDLPWGTRVHREDAMSLITVAEVTAKLDALMGSDG